MALDTKWDDIVKCAEELSRVAIGESEFDLPKGEPLKINETWVDGDFFCRIIRVMPFGHLCGYVYVPKGHPYFGLDIKKGDKVPVDIHGGITCCHPNTLEENAFVLERSAIPYWRLGFDHMHAGDDPPIKDAKGYKDLKYVQKEVKSLLEQCEKAWIK